METRSADGGMERPRSGRRFWRICGAVALFVLALPVVYVVAALALMYGYFAIVMLVGALSFFFSGEAFRSWETFGSSTLYFVVSSGLLLTCLAGLMVLWVLFRRFLTVLFARSR